MKAKGVGMGQPVTDDILDAGEWNLIGLEIEKGCKAPPILRKFEKPIEVSIFYMKNPITGKIEPLYNLGFCLERGYRKATGDNPVKDYPSQCMKCFSFYFNRVRV